MVLVHPKIKSVFFIHRFKSSFIVFNRGVEQWNSSDSLGENCMSRYVIMPVVGGR